MNNVELTDLKTLEKEVTTKCVMIKDLERIKATLEEHHNNENKRLTLLKSSIRGNESLADVVESQFLEERENYDKNIDWVDSEVSRLIMMKIELLKRIELIMCKENAGKRLRYSIYSESFGNTTPFYYFEDSKDFNEWLNNHQDNYKGMVAKIEIV